MVQTQQFWVKTPQGCPHAQGSCTSRRTDKTAVIGALSNCKSTSREGDTILRWPSPWCSHPMDGWNSSGMLYITCIGLLGLQEHGVKPLQAFEHPSFKAMITVAAGATRGVTIPSRKVTRAHIINLFKKNVANLQERISVSYLQFSFCIFSWAICRKIQQALSHSPVMPGRQAIRMPTLLSQVTGMKKSHQITGRIIVHSLASHRWILPMMEFTLGMLYSRLLDGLG